MATLGQRLEALESRGNGGVPKLLLVWLSAEPSPAAGGGPRRRAEINGLHFESEPGESKDDFAARIEGALCERYQGARRPLVRFISWMSTADSAG